MSTERSSNDTPDREEQRLRALQEYDIMDAELHDELDGLVSLASKICGTPISLINLVDSHRQITKASAGIDLEEMAREDSFCQYTILDDEMMIVENAHTDERFRESPYVVGAPNIHFYAGMPLKNKDGHNFGAICVIDSEPNNLNEDQKESLKILAEEVVSHLELRRKNTRLKEAAIFLENSSDIRTIIDASDLTIQDVNQKTLDMLHCERDELLGKRFGSFMADEAMQTKVIDFLNQREQTTGTFTSKVQSTPGTAMFVRFSFSLRNGNWYMTGRDVTEAYEARQELKKQSQAIESSIDGIAILNEERIFTYMNEAHASIYGYRKEELVNGRWEHLIKPEEHSRFKKNVYNTLNNREQWRGEATGIKKDGTEFPVDISLSRMESDKLVCVVRDISQSKRIRMQLEQQKKLNEKIIDSLPIVFYMFDRQGNAVRWNSNLKETTGYSQLEVPYMHPLDFFPENEKKRVRQTIKKVFNEGEATVEAELRAKDGTTKPFMFSASRFISGEEAYMLGIGQDITHQKSVQQKLVKSLEEKEVLLAEIHHRVKNNLAIISGLLQLEGFNTEDLSVKKKLQDSQMRIHSMATIHELLYESDDFVHLPFQDFVSKIVESIRQVHDHDEKNIRVKLSDQDINLNVNQAIPCALIINELVTNAYEHAFTNRESGIIQIDVSNNEGRIHVRVVDDGKGMPDGYHSADNVSLGYTLIDTLTSQLEADLDIRQAGGTEIHLQFEKRDGKGSSGTILTA